MLLCLVVCLTLLASFFLPSHLSLKHVHVLRLLYSLIIYEIVNFSFFTLYSLLLLSFFLYLKSVPIYVIVHVPVSPLPTEGLAVPTSPARQLMHVQVTEQP